MQASIQNADHEALLGWGETARVATLMTVGFGNETITNESCEMSTISKNSADTSKRIPNDGSRIRIAPIFDSYPSSRRVCQLAEPWADHRP